MKSGLTIATAVSFCCLLGAPPARAQWVPPDHDNLGHLYEDASTSAYVFNDCPGDERTDFVAEGERDEEVDLLEFAAWPECSGNNDLVLYFRFAAAGTPQIQVAVDTDRQAGSGATGFAGMSDTEVSQPASPGYRDSWGTAGWEYLIQTRFGLGLQPAVFNSSYQKVGEGSATIGGGIVTINVAWPLLGFG